MGTEQFSPVRTVNAHGEHIQVVGQAWGDPVAGKQRVQAVSAAGGTIAPAGLFSTAPYTGPTVVEQRPKARQGKCLGNGDSCRAWATEKYPGYCNAHGRVKEGLSSWAPKGG